ncbi:MAG: hypothetical protein K2M19_05150, partial [Muribaculaceae bacterium]|nr:hypothetical protein [Muribaculaceae bacterium]
MKKYLLITALTATTAATAQDLSTEVVVDRTVTPVERIATRPGGLTPAIILPMAAPVDLRPQLYTDLSAITRAFEPFDPLGGSRTPVPSTYRGYVSAAYGPLLTTDIRAGYRFLESESLKAGAALSFASESYRSFQPADWNKNRYADGKVLGYVQWRPDTKSLLDAVLEGRVLSQGTCRWDAFAAQDVRLKASWTSRAGWVDYGARADIAFDHNGDLKQTAYDVD